MFATWLIIMFFVVVVIIFLNRKKKDIEDSDACDETNYGYSKTTKRKQTYKGPLILPERFIVFDLETTGLKSEFHEIIEIGAIRANRGSDLHETFQALIKPTKKIPQKISELTGITQDMVNKEGSSLETILPQFLEFIGDLPLVAYNADFDMAFLRAAIKKTQIRRQLKNSVFCALKMAREAWPGLPSYKLTYIAKTAHLEDDDTHRALGDCKRALFVFGGALETLKHAR